jgi:MarR family transcriptional regulator, temperature-dependent positive regulator of motility
MGDGPDSSGFMLADSASHVLRRLLHLAEDRFAHLSKVNGLNLRQFAVLAATAQSPGLSQSALVRATGIDRSTLADMMTRLERRGLITRTPSPADARANSVNLTLAGINAVTGSNSHAKAADAAILDLLSEPKQRAFVSTIKRIVKRADEVAEREEHNARRAAKRQARLEAKAAGKASKGKRKGRKDHGARAGKRPERKRKAKAHVDETVSQKN